MGHVIGPEKTTPPKRGFHRGIKPVTKRASSPGNDLTAKKPTTQRSPGRQNVVALGNRGGRCRWKIENKGFNLQKNNGFNLEHACSTGQLQISFPCTQRA
jgi:hypothetical protein